MRLHLLAQPRDIQVIPLEPVASGHTGELLRSYEFELNVADDDTAEELSKQLDAGRGSGEALRDDDGASWVVISYRRSQQGNGPWTFTAVIRKSENPNAEQIELLEMTLTPLYYKEDLEHSDRLVIIFEVEPTSDIAQRLETALRERDDYFAVRRIGVSDTPVAMRWGRCVWQRLENGDIRHHLTLVGEDGDEPSVFLGLNEPELSNTSRIAIKAHEAIDALLTELADSGHLSTAAVNRIREQANTAWVRRHRDLAETVDVSQYR